MAVATSSPAEGETPPRWAAWWATNRQPGRVSITPGLELRRSRDQSQAERCGSRSATRVLRPDAAAAAAK
jgi:hypothetical protein